MPKLLKIPTDESVSSSSDGSDIVLAPTRGKAALYHQICTLRNASTVEEAMTLAKVQDEHLIRDGELKSTGGFLRCKYYSKKYFAKCFVRVRVRLADGSWKMEQNDKNHKHIDLRSDGLTKSYAAARKEVERLDKKKMTAEVIRQSLKEDGIADLTLVQVENGVQRCRKKNQKGRSADVGEINLLSTMKTLSTMNTLDLADFIARNSERPEDRNKFFVVGSYIEEDVDAKYIVMLSTLNLLSKLGKVDSAQVDSTYKMLRKPDKGLVMLLGSSDAQKRFHPLIVAVSSNEDTESYSRLLTVASSEGLVPTVMISDGAKSITKAIKAVFPDCQRAMCWFHLSKIIKDQWRGLGRPKLYHRVKNDISYLQRSRNLKEFKKAGDLFVAKWSGSPGRHCVEFIKFFTKTYINGHLKYWFEGASRHPSTNNGLESKNGWFKKEFRREAFHLETLLVKLGEIMELESSKNKDICAPVVPSTTTWRDGWTALQLSKKKRKNKVCPLKFLEWSPNRVCAVKSIIDKKDIKIACQKRLNGNWKSFDHFKYSINTVFVIDLHEWGTTCTCNIGIKKAPCIHYCAVRHLQKIEAIPLDCRSFNLGGAMPGRKKKASKG